MLIVAGFPAFTGWLLIVFSAYIVDNLNGFVATLLIGRLLTGGAAGISAGAVAVSGSIVCCGLLAAKFDLQCDSSTVILSFLFLSKS